MFPKDQAEDYARRKKIIEDKARAAGKSVNQYLKDLVLGE